MEFKLNTRYGFDLEVTDKNTKISEGIENRIYTLDEQGRADITKPIKRDIIDDPIREIQGVLNDIMSYRVAEYDSTDLIGRLFERMPEDKAIAIIRELMRDYELEETP